MKTDDLIAALAASAEPVPAGPMAPRKFAAPLGVGVVAAVILMAVWLGFADLKSAAVSGGFWLKLIYAAVLGGLGVVMAARLSRPGAVLSVWLVLSAPVLIIILMAVGFGQLMMAPDADRMDLMRGGSWSVCSRLIVAVATPVYLGLVVALRGLAPTRPALAGAAAGLAAGGIGAAVYALHCPEYAPAFIALWYTAGILASAALGGLVGWRLLRW
jgi:hypothetical protein